MNNNHDSYEPGQIRLRYNRSDRLKRASKAVQQMYEPDYIAKPGLLKSLTATKASRSILFSLIIVFILTVLSVFIQFDRKAGHIHGIPVKLELLAQEQRVYINILFDKTKREDSYLLPVTVHITARHTGSGKQEIKTIEAAYIGSPLRLPAQFSSAEYTEIEAIISADNKTLQLRSSLGK